MKVKNLLLAGMVVFAGAFTACSNDDDPINGGEIKGDATLDIKIAAPVSTKATTAVGKTDATISKLGIYVFDILTGELEGYALTNDDKGVGDLSRKVSKLSAGAKKVVVLANYLPNIELIKKYETFITQTLEMSNDEVDGNLSMNSATYSIDIVAGKTNYLGYTSESTGVDANGNFLPQATTPVKLYRNVAKVVLRGLNFIADNNKYKNAKLTVNRVFILHGAKETKVVAASEWSAMATGSSYINGPENNDYTTWVTAMTGLSPLKKYIKNANTYSSLNNYISTQSYELVNSAGTNNIVNVDSFYVFENPNAGKDVIQTLLVVEASMDYGTVKGAPRYYTVGIGDVENPTKLSGVSRPSADATTGVVRNLQYNVTLNVAGPGRDTPFGPDPKDNTFLDAQVEVVPFGQVNQDVTIE